MPYIKRPRHGLDLDSLREACKSANVGSGFYPKKFLGYGIEGGAYACKSPKLALKVGCVSGVWRAYKAGLFNELLMFPRVVHTEREFVKVGDTQYYAIWREYCVAPKMSNALSWDENHESKVIHEARRMMDWAIHQRHNLEANTPPPKFDVDFREYPTELARLWDELTTSFKARSDIGDYHWDMHNFNFGFIKRRNPNTRKFERHVVCFDPISV